jgi:hypothetical protein
MVEVKNNEVARQPHLTADFSPDPLRDKMSDQYAGQHKHPNGHIGLNGQGLGRDDLFKGLKEVVNYIRNCLLTKFGHPYIFFKKNS